MSDQVNDNTTQPIEETKAPDKPGFFSWNTVKRVGVGIGFVGVVGLAVVGVIAISKGNGNINLPNV